jgi:hypothetical protein
MLCVTHPEQPDDARRAHRPAGRDPEDAADARRRAHRRRGQAALAPPRAVLSAGGGDATSFTARLPVISPEQAPDAEILSLAQSSRKSTMTSRNASAASTA